MIRLSDQHIEMIGEAYAKRTLATAAVFEAGKNNIVKSEWPENYTGELTTFFRNLENAENEVTIITGTVKGASEVLKEKLDAIAATTVDESVQHASAAEMKGTVGKLY